MTTTLIKLIIEARIEEVSILGRFTHENYLRDKLNFETYKPLKYGPGFAAALLLKIEAVEAVVFPKTITAQLKLVTGRIGTNMTTIRPMLNRLEGYVEDAAADLTIGVKDFGIKQVRQKLTNDDQEGLDGALKYLLDNINVTANMTALTNQGYTTAERDALADLKKAIRDDNVLQNNLEEQRAQLRVDNVGLINDLCKDLKGIWADGKRLFKLSNATKAKDYTLAQLKNRIRQEELKTELTGKVFTLSGAPATKKAKVVARPVGGGRSKTVYSDKNAVYDLKGLKAVPTLITVTLDDGTVFVVSGEPVTKEKVVLDLKPTP